MPEPPKFSPQDVTTKPGVYVFRNSAGEVVYVGKARSLRKRLSTYFQPSRKVTADAKLRALIHSIASYETIEVKSEAEALLLESRLIKQYHPRYNVELRDDKRYLHLCIDLQEAFPRFSLVRIRREDGRIYFGPFPFSRVLRATADFLSKRFQLRTCNFQEPGEEQFKHCLDSKIQTCSCPCVGKISREDYRKRVEEALAVLRGNLGEVAEELTRKMQDHSTKLEFEEAARTRDMLENLRTICKPNQRTFRRTTLDGRRSAPGSEAVRDLQRQLRIIRPPNHIECFDMSNIGGRFAVGSMVVFREGRPSGKDYRRFRIRSESAKDDTAMMREVLTRRYSRLLEEEGPMPDLIMVDGGKGQLHTAMQVLASLSAPIVPLLGLAKKNEEVFLPGKSTPVLLPHDTLGLKLLQAVRDEAHRFAISYHRELRGKRLRESVLDAIPGIGAKRRRELLSRLGSARRIAESSPADIAAAVPGLGLKLAEMIRANLRHQLNLDPEEEN